MTLEARQVALLSAALRHTQDADGLLNTSPDQAWHLAGFGPECARKACLSTSWADRVLGHHLGDPMDPLVHLAVGLDVVAARYRPEGWAQRWPVLGDWRVEHRYDRTGTHSAAGRDLVVAARQAVDEVVAALWADGVLATPEI